MVNRNTQKAIKWVSTHSRLKAAGDTSFLYRSNTSGFNTQPPEGGWASLTFGTLRNVVSTHSRLKAAGRKMAKTAAASPSFNTQPPEGGWLGALGVVFRLPFQHTAA